MPYSAHYIIYTALSTLYWRALHPDCMFATKQLYNNNYNNKDMDVPLAFFITFLSWNEISSNQLWEVLREVLMNAWSPQQYLLY